jgi:hypothetical protein
VSESLPESIPFNQQVHQVLSDARPRTRYLIGTDAKLSAFLKRNLPDRWMDAIIFWMFGLPRRVKYQEGGYLTL